MTSSSVTVSMKQRLMLAPPGVQVQTLQEEKASLEKALGDIHQQHKEELEIQQLQHFQVLTDMFHLLDVLSPSGL